MEAVMLFLLFSIHLIHELPNLTANLKKYSCIKKVLLPQRDRAGALRTTFGRYMGGREQNLFVNVPSLQGG